MLSLPKNFIFSPSAKIKICILSKAPPPHQHTKQVYIWICPVTTSIPVYRVKLTFDLKSSKLVVLDFIDPPPH